MSGRLELLATPIGKQGIFRQRNRSSRGCKVDLGYGCQSRLLLERLAVLSDANNRCCVPSTLQNLQLCSR